MRDVYVFGDSHWRVFFPFLNTGSPGISHEQDGVRTVDTTANELSGATMWGLLNDNSKNGARRRILATLDDLGGGKDVGLVFGEVDARYHHDRYFKGTLSRGRIFELLSRYAMFIHEDLIGEGRARNVFVYHGFRYPLAEQTLLQPDQPIGTLGVAKARAVNSSVGRHLYTVVNHPSVHVMRPTISDEDVSPDGVHLIPERMYPRLLTWMKEVYRWQ